MATGSATVTKAPQAAAASTISSSPCTGMDTTEGNHSACCFSYDKLLNVTTPESTATSRRESPWAPATVAVVGLGYIGLPTAVSLATGGLDVVGVDVSARIVELVNRGEAPFAEPDLSVGVSGAVAMGRLTARRRCRRRARSSSRCRRRSPRSTGRT